MIERVTASQKDHGVEYDIRPPMRLAVTIPIYVDGRDYGVVVYVAVGAFAARIPPGVHSNYDVVTAVVTKIQEALK